MPPSRRPLPVFVVLALVLPACRREADPASPPDGPAERAHRAADAEVDAEVDAKEGREDGGDEVTRVDIDPPPPEPRRRELEIVELETGEGVAAAEGDEAVVRFAASLLDGTVFASRGPADPLRFRIGDPAVIPGLSAGLEGMKPGGRRRVTIPPRLGYGQRGVEDPATGGYAVPPGAALVVELELLELEAAP